MSRCLALAYDWLVAPAEFLSIQRWRAELLSPLRGRVLELGAGTGQNLDHYSTPAQLTLSEPDPHLGARLRRKLTATGRSDTLIPASGESLPFAAGSFDAIVATLVLCSVADVDAVLGEAARCLVPGGKLVLIDHVAAPEGSSRRRWQERLDPTWQRLAGGCHLLRDPRQQLANHGFAPERVETDEMRGAPAFLRSVIRGTWLKSD